MVGWKGYAAAGGVAAVLAGIAVYQVTTWRADARYANVVASNAVVMQAYADRATAAESAQRAEETRRQDDKDRIENETRLEIAGAQAAAAAAGTERDRLRKQLAVYTAGQRRPGANPATGAVGPSEPGSDAIGLLADLFTRADDTAGDMAQYADSLRIAGAACERSYNSLIPGNAP